MAGDTHEGQLPRYLQSKVADALVMFTEDADRDDRNTSQGFHDVLERTHGLDTIDSRRRLTSILQQREQEMAELDEKIRTRRYLAERTQQMIVEVDEARAKLMAENKTLGSWKHTKPAELIQQGLDMISQFVTSNPAIVPDLLEMLKPSEGKCRSEIKDASKSISGLLSQLADMQRRCNAYDEMLDGNGFGNQEAPNALVEDIESRMTLMERQLAEKSRDFDIMSKQAEQADQLTTVTEEKLERVVLECKNLEATLQKNETENRALRAELYRSKEAARQAAEAAEAAEDLLSRERDFFDSAISSKEKELQKLRREHEQVLSDVKGICQTASMEQSTADKSLSLPRLVHQAIFDVAAQAKKIALLEEEKLNLQKRLVTVNEDITQRNSNAESCTHTAVENVDGRKHNSEPHKTITNRMELIAQLLLTNECDLMGQTAATAESEPRDISHPSETMRFCSSVLATVSTHGGTLHVRSVDMQSLQMSWETALRWSHRSSLTRRRFGSIIHGLVEPEFQCDSVLDLVRGLLIRAHMAPSFLSVALVEELALVLDTASETVVTEAMGFVYALLQEKGQSTRRIDTWSFSKALLIVRCLSMLVSCTQEAKVCSELAIYARDIRSKVPSSSILVRVMLEHAIKILTGSTESLADTFAQSTFAQRVKSSASYTLYPDGANLVVVDADGNIAFVRPNQFDWHNEEQHFKMSLKFHNAPLLGTCRIVLPSLAEEMFLFDILNEVVARADRADRGQLAPVYHPDYTSIVE